MRTIRALLAQDDAESGKTTRIVRELPGEHPHPHAKRLLPRASTLIPTRAPPPRKDPLLVQIALTPTRSALLPAAHGITHVALRISPRMSHCAYRRACRHVCRATHIAAHVAVHVASSMPPCKSRRAPCQPRTGADRRHSIGTFHDVRRRKRGFKPPEPGAHALRWTERRSIERWKVALCRLKT